MKKDLKIDESKGECICDVCKGNGSTIDEHGWYNVCWKCQGDGKLDWVSHITGKPMKPEAIFSTCDIRCNVPSSAVTFNTCSISCNVPSSAVMDLAAKQLAKDRDKQIIDDIVGQQQQKPKAEKYYKKEDKAIDNGFFSKLMLHFNLKQKFKSKTN